MQTPKGWDEINTGGGCTAFCKENNDADVYWLITKQDDPSSPTNPSDPCTLSLNMDAESPMILKWECSCLAEAVMVAESSSYI